MPALHLPVQTEEILLTVFATLMKDRCARHNTTPQRSTTNSLINKSTISTPYCIGHSHNQGPMSSKPQTRVRTPPERHSSPARRYTLATASTRGGLVTSGRTSRRIRKAGVPNQTRLERRVLVRVHAARCEDGVEPLCYSYFVWVIYSTIQSTFVQDPQSQCLRSHFARNF
jgi:hypothetical protein